MVQPPVPAEGQHYSPASLDGRESAALAKQVSRAFTDAYYRGKGRANRDVEAFGYLPPGQPQDDLWSGSLLDERFWRSNSDVIISRKATGLTREQRAVLDPAAPARPPPVDGATPVRFFESTKSRSRAGR